MPGKTDNLLDPSSEIKIDEEWSKRLASEIFSAVKADKASAEGHRNLLAKITRMYNGDVKRSQKAFEGSQVVHRPILSRAILHLQARQFDQIVPPDGDIWRPVPSKPGREERDRIDRIKAHGNWQIRHEIPDWANGIDTSLMQWDLYGSMFRYVCHDYMTDKLRPEYVPTEDIIIPYSYKSTDPYMSDIPRVTRVRRYHQHEYEDLITKGIFVDWRDEKEKTQEVASGNSNVYDTSSRPVTAQANESSGIEPSTNDSDKPLEFFETHTWRRIPNDPIGRSRHVMLTIETRSQKLVSLRITEDEDPIDRNRYNNEMKLRQFQIDEANAQYEQKIVNLAQDPNALPEHALAIPKPEVPAMPEPIKLRPVWYIVHYGCIPNSEGFYNHSPATFLQPMNEIADSAMSAMMDSALVANAPFIIADQNCKMQRGEIEYKPGGVFYGSFPNGIDSAIKVIQFPQANPQLANIAEMEANDADRLSGSADILAGVGSDRGTATEAKLKSAHAQMSIAIQVRRFLEAFKCELKLYARHNSVFLPDNFTFPVAKPDGSIEMTTVSREDYIEDFDITFMADPRMFTKAEKIEDARDTLAMVMSDPELAQNPAASALRHAVRSDLLIAKGRPDLVALLPPPIMPPAMPGMPPGAPGPGGPMPGPGGPAMKLPTGPVPPPMISGPGVADQILSATGNTLYGGYEPQ